MADQGKQLTTKAQLVIYMAAEGKTVEEMADTLQCSSSRVREILMDPNTEFEIKRLRYKLYGKDIKKQFNEMLPEALNATKDILENPNTKAPLRFQAAQEVFDRALGKPKQTVEVEGSLLRDVFEALDSRKRDVNVSEIIDVDPSHDEYLPALSDNPNRASVRDSEDDNPNTHDAIDSWANENL